MGVYFLDTSALVKSFFVEKATYGYLVCVLHLKDMITLSHKQPSSN